MVKININIDPVVLERLRKRARAEGRTVSEIIRQLVAEYLEKREKGK